MAPSLSRISRLNIREPPRDDRRWRPKWRRKNEQCINTYGLIWSGEHSWLNWKGQDGVGERAAKWFGHFWETIGAVFSAEAQCAPAMRIHGGFCGRMQSSGPTSWLIEALILVFIRLFICLGRQKNSARLATMKVGDAEGLCILQQQSVGPRPRPRPATRLCKARKLDTQLLREERLAGENTTLR